MFNNNQRKGLKAWIRFDGNNNAVAGSLIFQKDKPKVGKWKEYMDVNLCCPSDCNVNYGAWKLVTGGAAGDGVALVDDLPNNEFTIVGPNDDDSNGWVYLTRYFPDGGTLLINYEYASFDSSLDYDRPVYWNSLTQPTGAPDDTTARVDEVPASGNWEVIVPPGQWFAVGIYSTDSCCGRGFLSIAVEIGEFYTLPGEWFLLDAYSAAFEDGSITFPDHANSEPDINPNDVGQTGGLTATQIYINPKNSDGDDYVAELSALVGSNGQLRLIQGSTSVTYSYTSQAFQLLTEGLLVNIAADNTFGDSVPGSITIQSPALGDFNYDDPINIQIQIN